VTLLARSAYLLLLVLLLVMRQQLLLLPPHAAVLCCEYRLARCCNVTVGALSNPAHRVHHQHNE
jgi:hypothetical protein